MILPGTGTTIAAVLWLAPATAAPVEPAPEPIADVAPVWEALGQCESGGDPTTNTGNGFFGLYQFEVRSWEWVGGDEFAPMPHQATAEEQTIAAERLVAKQGWAAAFPACSRKLGLSGGEG